MMKMFSTVAAMLLLAIPTMGLAEERAQQSDDEVAEGRAMVLAGREQIIRDELPLTDEEAAGFWPVHAKYQADMTAIMDRYTAMLTEFVGRYDSGDFTDEYASGLLDEFFGIKQELLDVQTSYIPKFKAVVPALKVAQFFQLENKITAEIDAQLAVAIPLIDPT